MAEPRVLAAGARTLLFVPADRPARFPKALAAGADLVVLDLEDAVPPERKHEARQHVVAAVGVEHRFAVRINASGTPWHNEDVGALCDRPCVLMLPKAESPDAVADLVARLAEGSAVIALVETAAGVLASTSVAAAPGVARLALGTFDLAAQLSVAPDDREAMAAARGQLVLASFAAGLPGPIDGVTGDVSSPEALQADVDFARRLGFGGKLCIHPRQVPVAAARLRPGDAEVEWARTVLRAVAASEALGSAVVVVAGQMVDKPVVDRAKRLLREFDLGLD